MTIMHAVLLIIAVGILLILCGMYMLRKPTCIISKFSFIGLGMLLFFAGFIFGEEYVNKAFFSWLFCSTIALVAITTGAYMSWKNRIKPENPEADDEIWFAGTTLKYGGAFLVVLAILHSPVF